MYDFLSFFLDELIVRDSKLKAISIKNLRFINEYNFKFIDFIEIDHFHRIFTAVGFKNKLLVNFCLTKNGSELTRRNLFSGFQIPFID
jgi:hypothetical protein